MFSITLIMVAAAFVVILGFALVAFVSVAFDKRAAAAGLEGNAWNPPPLRGRALWNWAARSAERIASLRLAGRRTPTAMNQMTREIQGGVTHAIDAALSEPVSLCEQDCRNRRFAMIGVSAAEALSVTEYLRANRPPVDVERIYRRAKQNAARAADMNQLEYQMAHVTCPLIGGDESCEAYPIRPLACRGWCPGCGENSESDGAIIDESNSADPAATDNWVMKDCAHVISRAADVGLRRALKSAQLDDISYEMNSALVAAFETPNATDRFLRGEPIFADCKKIERSARAI